MEQPGSFALIALNRIAFGPSSEQLRDPGVLAGLPLEAHFEAQLHPTSIADLDCDRRLAEAKLPTLTKSLKQLWADHRVAADRLRDAEKGTEKGAEKSALKSDGKPVPGSSPDHDSASAYKGGDAQKMPPPSMQDEQHLRQQPARETEIATWIRAVYSRRQLQEVVVDFWHNHFNVFAWDNPIAPVFVHYDRDVIRAHAFGNFRELLEAVAKSPAMSQYLDGFLNQSGNPNENYARELFELHTLGAENYLGTRDRTKVPGYGRGEPTGYVDGDVYEAARCFTGWRVDANQKEAANTGEFAYYDSWHDRFQKIVLGHALPEYQPPLKDGHDVLDMLAAHPGTARYVCRKLCRRLVTDDPPAALVESVAKVFREHRQAPDQLRRVVRAILLSPQFRVAHRTKLKRPFETTAGLLRATGADFTPSEPFLRQYQRAGQRLFAWRSPDGYPDTRERWGGTTPMLERWRLANTLLLGKVDGVKIDLPRPAGADQAGDGSALARALCRGLLGTGLAPARERAIAEFLLKDAAPGGASSVNVRDDRLHGAAALAFMSPEFLWR